MNKVKRWWLKRTFDRYRLGTFWCEKHWNIIKKSYDDPKPISPSIAAMGIAEALWLKDIPPDKVRITGRACCWVDNLDKDNKGILNGIFERSRNYGFGI